MSSKAPGDNPLKTLSAAGQAVWLDFVSRDFLRRNELQKLVEQDGVTGVTSNPSIFEKAMGHGTDYDESLEAFLAEHDADAVGCYEHLAIEDIRVACDILRPTYDRLNGQDGFVSLEVSPYLAFDTKGTLDEARRLWRAVDRPNLMVKIPGTDEGVPAIRDAIEDGININVTLLFSREAYRKVAEAYLEGLEARVRAGKPVDRIGSVASFFVSRIDGKIDAAIDARLEQRGDDERTLKSLKGKVAVANAQLAYADYEALIAQPRWKRLAEKGARVQRLLWASTGTKNPEYRDTLYVDTLVGRDTVNTMPPKTMDAFRDHGQVTPDSIRHDLDGARKVIGDTTRLGLDLDGVTAELVREGAKQFTDAADSLLAAVGGKRASIIARRKTAGS